MFIHFYFIAKVDRSVTGLVAQQQCVGPLHTPLADVAVTALSHFSTVSKTKQMKHHMSADFKLSGVSTLASLFLYFRLVLQLLLGNSPSRV